MWNHSELVEVRLAAHEYEAQNDFDYTRYYSDRTNDCPINQSERTDEEISHEQDSLKIPTLSANHPSNNPTWGILAAQSSIMLNI
ncbi:MAG: hypothetical protein V7K88_11960 [Nostoc sp.]|uniref:hypothetical protein n=1 Tax=Nostoc sp. TaxID=1180 RepID=UPI002FFADFC7